MRFTKPIELHMIFVQLLKMKLIVRVLKLIEVRVVAISHNLAQKGFLDIGDL